MLNGWLKTIDNKYGVHIISYSDDGDIIHSIILHLKTCYFYLFIFSSIFIIVAFVQQ